MPAYTIETTFTLPIFRHGTYIADTPGEACKAALVDENCRRIMMPPVRFTSRHLER